ncbi:hypothetical protein F4604DRAFT_44654 [Suillus subluteus]|nr:hypothetical protein F4604DRAFT_44654 [Suillus subluteus]
MILSQKLRAYSTDGWSPIRCARDIDSDRRPSASRRVRAVRYSPYISASSTARQSSNVSLTHSQSDQEDSSRSSSPNPSFVSSAYTTAFTSSFLQERKAIHHSNFIICSSQDTTKLACGPYFRSTGVRRETGSYHTTVIDANVIAHHPPNPTLVSVWINQWTSPLLFRGLMMVQLVYDVVAAYPKEGFMDLLILTYTHTQLSFAFRLNFLVSFS